MAFISNIPFIAMIANEHPTDRQHVVILEVGREVGLRGGA